MEHLVFCDNDARVLGEAILLDDALKGEILVVRDDLSIGPVSALNEAEGFQARKAWWAECSEASTSIGDFPHPEDKLMVHHLCKRIAEGKTDVLWIWMGQNARDVAGYYWLTQLLKPFQGKVQVVFLNNLPFFLLKGGIFFPTHLHQIQPKEFLKAKKLARPVTVSEFELDPEEWDKIATTASVVRWLEGGKKLTSKSVGWVENQALEVLGNEPQKLTKTLSALSTKFPLKFPDHFWAWYYCRLAQKGTVETIGNWASGYKDVTVQLKS